jgi:hypothetical protein
MNLMLCGSTKMTRQIACASYLINLKLVVVSCILVIVATDYLDIYTLQSVVIVGTDYLDRKQLYQQYASNVYIFFKQISFLNISLIILTKIE